MALLIPVGRPSACQIQARHALVHNMLVGPASPIWDVNVSHYGHSKASQMRIHQQGCKVFPTLLHQHG